MTTRKSLLALGLVALLAAALLVPAAAWGSETEDPFWKVAGSRLEAGSQSASIENPSGVKTILHGKIGATEVAIRCESGALGEGALEGSQVKQPGKASGVLELSECKLFAKEGETFKEQTKCKVPTIKSGKLAGAMRLEGTRAAAGTAAVVVFEPKELTEGKQLVAKVVVEGCSSFKGPYPLEGSFALRLLPQNEEFTFIQWVLPEAAIATVWLPPAQEASVGLKLEGATASLQGEMKTELASKEKFGGGTAPTVAIEAPFWGVNDQRLEAGEERELEDAPAGPTKLSWKIVKTGQTKGTEVETRCNSAQFKEPKLIGSLTQHDGRFFLTSIEFSECKLLAKEGGVYVEQPACEVAPPNTNPLSGRLWLKGTSAERGMIPLVVLEPQTLTEGKPVLAEESVKSKAGEKCAYTVEKYAIEGALPFRLQPESVEAQVVNLSVPESSTAVWQSAEQQMEKQTIVYHGGELLNIKIGNIPVKLKAGGPFGGGSAGVGEIGFESNTGRVSGPIKTFPATATFKSSEGYFVECKSTGGEAPAGEWVIQVKTANKEGRQEATTRGPHEWLQIKKWGKCTATLEFAAKVKCNVQVARIGTGSIYPLGTTGTTGCELAVGPEGKICTVKVPVEGNKERPTITLKNLGINEVEIGGEAKGLIFEPENTGVCKELGIKIGGTGALTLSKPLITEGQKLV